MPDAFNSPHSELRKHLVKSLHVYGEGKSALSDTPLNLRLNNSERYMLREEIYYVIRIYFIANIKSDFKKLFVYLYLQNKRLSVTCKQQRQHEHNNFELCSRRIALF